MCGIFGFSIPMSLLSPEERAVLGVMLGTQNDSRGGDSWGAYVVNGDIQIVRGLGSVATGLAWPGLLGQAHVLMGHTRKATSGAISIPNSHPFEVGNIVGAHNGFVTNHDEMNKKYNRKFDVDSMHIFAHIQKGWRLTELTGYGAIEYTNKKKWPERINLCKVSSGGDLCIAGIDVEVATEGTGRNKTETLVNPKGIVWSSSEYHLKNAMDAAGLNKRYSIYRVDTGVIYSIKDGGLAVQSRKLELSTTVFQTHSSYCGPGARTVGFGRTERWDGDFKPVTAVYGFDVHYDQDIKFYVDPEAGALAISREEIEDVEPGTSEPTATPLTPVESNETSEDPIIVNGALLRQMAREEQNATNETD